VQGEQDDKVNQLTYEQVTLQQPATGRIVQDYISNSVRIAGKAWGLPDLQAVKPADVYVRRIAVAALISTSRSRPCPLSRLQRV
jgi:hypothetical protein